MKSIILPGCVPGQLKELPRWCCWRLGDAGSNGKPKKIPVLPDGSLVGPNKPELLVTFEAALAAYETRDDIGGVNFLPGRIGDGELAVGVIDFDGCVDEQERLDPRVEHLLERLATYAEYSPSATGVHAWFLTPVEQRNVAKPDAGIEFYSGSHFMSCTGNANLGTPRELATISAEAVQQAVEYFLQPPAAPDPEERQERQRAENKQQQQQAAGGDETGRPHHLTETAERCVARLADRRAEDRGEWVAVMMALRWVAEQTGDAEPLRQLWHEFSSRCAAKYDRDDADKTWESYQPRGDNGGRVTIASLISWARADSDATLEELTGRRQGRELLIVSGDAVQPVPVRWLWKGRIPRGKLTLFSGDGGEGKSFVVLDLAARVTRGREWSDRQPCPLGDALILNLEDDLGDTIVPRLLAADADMRRVGFYSGMMDRGKRCAFDLGRHVDELERHITARPELKLLIVDPLGMCAGGRDFNKFGEMYGLIGPCNELAARYDVAVVLVTHLNKAEGLSALYRTVGSTAIIGAARCAWTVMRDPRDGERKRRLLLPTKHNNSNGDDCGMSFRLVADAETEIARVEWDEQPVELTADEAMRLATSKRGRSDGDEEPDAVEFLRVVLADGPLGVLDVERQAKQFGVSMRSCHRHKDRLGIVAKRVGFGKGGHWTWELPEAEAARGEPSSF